MGPRYVLQLLLLRNKKIPNSSTITEAREIIATDCVPLGCLKFFDLNF
jgi:hypothetical protein